MSGRGTRILAWLVLVVSAEEASTKGKKHFDLTKKHQTVQSLPNRNQVRKQGSLITDSCLAFSDTKSLVSHTYNRHVCWHSPSLLLQK